MNEFPKGWFYLHCPSRFDQVLTIPSASMQPTQKLELRPKVENNAQQLWTYDEGFLINKHSAYVVSCKDSQRLNQNIYPLTRSKDMKGQRWKLDHDSRLVLMDRPDLGINDLAVPRLVENGCVWRCENDIIA